MTASHGLASWALAARAANSKREQAPRCIAKVLLQTDAQWWSHARRLWKPEGEGGNLGRTHRRRSPTPTRLAAA